MRDQIERIRNKVDRIDKRILKLLVKRYGLVTEIGEQKRLNKISVVDKERESNILRRFRNLIKDDSVYNYVENIYRSIFSSSYKVESLEKKSK